MGDEIIGLRPEQLLPKEAYRGHGRPVSFRLRVTRVEDLGAERIVYGCLEEQLGNARVSARLSPDIAISFQQGKDYEFVIEETALRLFDRATGLQNRDYRRD
ncbi:MAG: hypothetical protein M5R38_05160 [Candidatus Methylomirabilis sp.]|nr:hypothetical protein [Candidatus Methylomirabilis sp.]